MNMYDAIAEYYMNIQYVILPVKDVEEHIAKK